MIRIKVVLWILLVWNVGTQAQKPVPVHFSFRAEKTGSTTFAVHLTATMDTGWHIYAQVQPESAISTPTRIFFTKNPLIILSGPVVEKGFRETQKIASAGIEQYMYAGKVDFVQSVTLKASVHMTLSGTITYQVCTEEECLPPATVPFCIAVP